MQPLGEKPNQSLCYTLVFKVSTSHSNKGFNSLKERERERERERDRQTDRQTDRQKDRQTDGERERQTGRQTDTQRETDRQRKRERERERERERGGKENKSTRTTHSIRPSWHQWLLPSSDLVSLLKHEPCTVSPEVPHRQCRQAKREGVSMDGSEFSPPSNWKSSVSHIPTSLVYS